MLKLLLLIFKVLYLLALIDNVLDATRTYMMFLFPIPKSVIEGLDVLRRNFLWQGNSDSKKFHLVKREALIGSKKARGLGIRNLKEHNQSLLLKGLGDSLLMKNPC